MSLGVSQFGQNLGSYILTVRNALTEISPGIAEWGGTLIKNTSVDGDGFQYSVTWNEINLFRIFGRDSIGSSLPFWSDVSTTGQSFGTANGDTQGRFFRGTRNTNARYFDIGFDETDKVYFSKPHDGSIVSIANRFAFVIDGDGRIGTIQVPTANLHLKAGSNTAGNAPFKLTAGVNLTTPETGAIEYDGTKIYFTPSAARRSFAFTDNETFTNGLTLQTGVLNIPMGSVGAPSLRWSGASNTGIDSLSSTSISFIISGGIKVSINTTGIVLPDGNNISSGTTSGSKFGTATNQLLSFWNATPIVQPSSEGETAGFSAGAGTAVNDDSTFTGNVGTKAYTISDIVKHLKNAGLIAAS